MFTADSIFTLSRDSLVQQTEPLLALPNELFLGFEGVSIQTFLSSDTWVLGIVLFLFFLLAFSVWLNPGLFLDNLKSAGGIKKEYFGSLNLKLATAPAFLLVYLILSSGLIALFLYLFIQKETMQLDLSVYLSFVGITLAYLILKFFIARFICYCFFDKKTFIIFVKMAYNLLLLLSFLLFPLLVLAIYSSFLEFNLLLTIGAVIFALIALVFSIRLFQLFYKKKLDFFYILLYLCSLEIPPVLVLFQVYVLIA